MSHILKSAYWAARHPAFLFCVGNTALAIGEAEPIGITLLAIMCFVIFTARFLELQLNKRIGISFLFQGGMNFVAALSVEFNHALGSHGSYLFAQGLKHINGHFMSQAFSALSLHNLVTWNHALIAAHISAFAYVAWGIGHIFASRHEKHDTIAKTALENPQTYYGIGDMSAVNASGTVNPFSFPFMIVGFIKSIFVGRKRATPHKNAVLRFLDEEATAARIYGIGYIVGALTSIFIFNFFIAQLFWSAAYFQFKKDM